MRTNFQQRSRRGRKAALYTALTAAALLIPLIFLPGPLAAAFSYVAAPLFEVRIWAEDAVSSIPRYFTERASLIAEIDRLRAEVALEEALRAELHALREADLKVRLVANEETPRIIADVVRTPPETPYDTLVVAAGSDVGILKGALAYTGKVAIGQVISVNPKTSLIALFSTPGVHIPVYLWGAGVFANAEGMGGGVVRIGVPQGLSIREGDAVTLPIPGTAIFGTIDRIEADATNPEQYAYITQGVAPRSMRFVAIDTAVAPTITFEAASAAIKAMQSDTSPFAPLLESLPAMSTTTATSTP